MDYSESLKKIINWIISEVTQDNENHIHVPLMVLNLESIEFQKLDIIENLGVISGIAREVKELNSSFDTFYDIIQNVNHVLFEIHGIHGNVSDYHNPENSFLSKVLETKSGNPVSISIIYQEICRQLGFHLTGIGIPGHYLLKYGEKESLIFMDPYNKGVLLTKKEVLQITNKKNKKNNSNIKILDSHIEEFGPRKTILRVLNNLKYSYSSVEEFEKALCISDIILKIQPNNLQNLIHMVSLHKEMDNFSDALELLDNFIEKSPEDSPITVDLINIRKKLFNKQ